MPALPRVMRWSWEHPCISLPARASRVSGGTVQNMCPTSDPRRFRCWMATNPARPPVGQQGPTRVLSRREAFRAIRMLLAQLLPGVPARRGGGAAAPTLPRLRVRRERPVLRQRSGRCDTRQPYSWLAMPHVDGSPAVPASLDLDSLRPSCPTQRGLRLDTPMTSPSRTHPGRFR